MQEEKSRVRSVSANAIIVPIECILTALLILIAVFVFEVNRSSTGLVEMIEDSGRYLQEVSSLQAGISTLAETANSFVQNPLTADGVVNVGPLNAYVQELGRNRRGAEIAQRFRNYDVNPQVKEIVNHAAEICAAMEETQAHAIALTSSVYPLPPIAALSAIPDYPLNEEETALSERARVERARRLLMASDYAQLRHAISEDVGKCNHILQEDFSRRAGETKQHVLLLRIALWITIVGIAVNIFAALTVMRRWIVRPLREHARDISADRRMRQLSIIQEMQLMAGAYNDLLDRRDKLEGILRSAAETDALTGLANRYSMERFALELKEGEKLAVLAFDVNFLKQVNDTQGHQAGDRLLRTVSSCIRECFADETGENCYRLGGDEFAAILRGCSEEEIKARIDRFAEAQKREQICVAVGCAYTPDGRESFQTLLGEADKRMYREKQKAHRDRGISDGDLTEAR